jgi:CheY-like chemotaxis protein
MISSKNVHKFSSTLHVLYVEDDANIRQETAMLFGPYFEKLDLAIDGIDGLDKYNQHHYDIVITDINMPRMNGIEMIGHMREINVDQKIIAISAHNESEILINLIRSGISSFILKPIMHQDLLNILYPVCRDADTQRANIDLFEILNLERSKLKKQVRLLEAQVNAISVKHQQVEHLLQQMPSDTVDPLLGDYFEKDEDDGDENVLFIGDDCDEITEYMQEIPEQLAMYTTDSNREHIRTAGENFRKISNILLHYTPFLDPLAMSIEELSQTIVDDLDAFIALLESNHDHVLTLFDAISIDLDRYMKRFSVESMAMKNIHHIHQPTSISIQQVIGLIHPDNMDEGDIEFF